MKHTFKHQIIYAVFAILSIILSVVFITIGMTKIKDSRFLSRLEIVPIKYAIEGDYLIQGDVFVKDKELVTPKFQSRVLAYEYKVEERYTDSDGDTQWRTIENKSDAVDFKIQDASADLTIRLRNLKNLPIEYPHQNTTRNGDYRYTERWIESNDALTLYGKRASSQMEIFTLPNDSSKSYFLNSKGLQARLSQLSTGGILQVWLGLTFVTLSLILLLIAMKTHRIIKFLFLLSVIQLVLLFYVGVSLISKDLNLSISNVASQSKILSTITDQTVKQDFEINYYQQLYSNAYHQLNKFPENIIGAFTASKLPESNFELLENKIRIVEINQSFLFWIMVLSIVLFFIFLWIGLKATIAKRMIENIPTSKIKGLMIGISEVKAVAKQYKDQVLTTPYSDTECYWFDYTEEEYRRSGKESKWVTVDTQSEWNMFNCEDDSEATLLVNPSKADISTKFKKVKKVGNTRYTESYLPFNESIYLLGNTSIGNASGRLMMKNESDQRLLISSFGEESLVLKKSIKAMFMMGAVFSVSILFGLIALGMIGSYEPSNYVLLGLFIPLFLVLMVAILHYNDILFLQNRVDRNFANIQVSLKKRYDLFTNLQKVISGYMEHEKNLLSTLNKLRGEFKRITDKKVATPDRVKTLLKQDKIFTESLNVTLENYPDLKSNELIEDFMQRQIDMEDEISLIREGYNDSVNCYNERIQSFPDLFLAKWFKFTKRRYV